MTVQKVFVAGLIKEDFAVTSTVMTETSASKLVLMLNDLVTAL